MFRKNYKTFLLFYATLKAVFKKEITHIRRSPSVLAYALIFPIVEIFMLGYLLDINVKQVDTMVYDLSNTQESRQLISSFTNTYDFKIIKYVNSDHELYQALKNGQIRVGVKIPVDFSRHLDGKATASILVLLDGSNTVVTGEAVNVFNRIALQESLKRLLAKIPANNIPASVETRTSVLFNPNTRSANFFLPGLIVWELPAVTILLVVLSIASEREKGTLEQLAMAPINPAGLIIGKMLPYLLLAFLELCEILLIIKYVFSIPINGSLLLLFILSILYMLASIGIGLTLSATVNTQIEAMQLGLIFRVVPPFYFTGYVFPIESSPSWFQSFTYIIPERHFMEISRGLILRGAGINHLWPHFLALFVMSILTLSLATFIYWRKLK